MSCCNSTETKVAEEKQICCSSGSKSKEDTVHAQVEKYYGQDLQSSRDLKTTACTSGEKPPAYVRDALSLIHDEVLSKFYGCGLVVPQAVEGCRVLDLGSGSGRDVYVLSKLVGAKGSVVGVDMTKEQLEVAERWKEYHRKAFGFEESNVKFVQAHIEDLSVLDSDQFDIVVSNCVVNLSTDKQRVLAEAYRVLKPGGEMYFSDVYADRRVPQSLQSDPVLYGECLSGALYWNDFLSLAKVAGFADPRLVTSRPLGLKNEQIERRIGHIGFFSATYRLFKVPDLEGDCEDYGQAVKYLGSVEECPATFVLDAHHSIEAGRMFAVCGNTYSILYHSRLRKHFQFFGDRSTHFGIFPGCGKDIPFRQTADEGSSAKSCC